MKEAWEFFVESFVTFNQNAVSSLVYLMKNNIWFILIAVNAALTAILKLKAAVDVTVHEEQNIV